MAMLDVNDATVRSLLDLRETAGRKKEPVTVGRGCSIRDACRKLVDNRIHALFVIDESEKLCGIFTSFDLALAMSQSAEPTTSVLAFMSSRPVTCYEDTPLAAAKDLLDSDERSHLPVIRHDRTIVAMLSKTDLVRHRAALAAAALEALERARIRKTQAAAGDRRAA